MLYLYIKVKCVYKIYSTIVISLMVFIKQGSWEIRTKVMEIWVSKKNNFCNKIFGSIFVDLGAFKYEVLSIFIWQVHSFLSFSTYYSWSSQCHLCPAPWLSWKQQLSYTNVPRINLACFEHISYSKVLLCPECGISTSKVFENFREGRNSPQIRQLPVFVRYLCGIAWP